MQICDYGSGESVSMGDCSHTVEEEAAAEEGPRRTLAEHSTAGLVPGSPTATLTTRRNIRSSWSLHQSGPRTERPG